MKIDGIDPLLLNKIKEQVDLKEIRQTESTSTDNRVTREGSSDSGKASKHTDPNYERKLDQAIARLNEDAEKKGQPLRFSARKGSNLWYVEVRDTSKDEVIQEIPTEKALEVANRIQNLFGILMDERR